jgi:predicted DNA binding protein
MRRVTLQFKLEDLAERDEADQILLKEIELFEVLHILKQDEREMAMIARVKLKDKRANLKKIFGDDLIETQLLEEDKNGVKTYFFKSREARNADDFDSILGFGGYLTAPFSVQDGTATMTFLGSSSEVKHMLKAIDEFKVPYKILSLSDAKFSPDSPLSSLTEKQRRVIVSAFNSGYYDVPRKISSEELADKLNIRAPTLVLHRRKAEHRLLHSIINGR